MINNTFVALGLRGDAATLLPERSFARNNLFIGAQRDAVKFHAEDVIRKPATCDFDYNGYAGAIDFSKWFRYREYVRAGDGQPWDDFARNDLARMPDAFQKRTGMETTRPRREGGRLFQRPAPDGESDQTTAGDLAEPADLRLKEGAPVIDKGAIVPNITDGFGRSPDLGALRNSASRCRTGGCALRPGCTAENRRQSRRRPR